MHPSINSRVPSFTVVFQQQAPRGKPVTFTEVGGSQNRISNVKPINPTVLDVQMNLGQWTNPITWAQMALIGSQSLKQILFCPASHKNSLYHRSKAHLPKQAQTIGLLPQNLHTSS